jgi:hypothetical protein
MAESYKPTRWLLTRQAQVRGCLYSLLPSDADSLSEDAVCALITEAVPVHGFPPEHAFIFRCLARDVREGSSLLRVCAGKGLMLWPRFEETPDADDARHMIGLLHSLGIGACFSIKDCGALLIAGRDQPDMLAIDRDRDLQALDPAALTQDMTRRMFVPAAGNTNDRLTAVLATGVNWLGDDDFDVVRSSTIAAESQGLLRVIGLTYSDGPIRTIVDAVEHQPMLVERLMRAANSPAYMLMGDHKPITTVHGIVQEFGINYLRLLCMFGLEVVYSRLPSRSVALTVTRIRSRFMERLATACHYGDEATNIMDPNEAFLVGLISMLPAITRTPIRDILAGIALPKRFDDALLNHAGFLGQLLHIAERYGTEDTETLVMDTIFWPRMTQHILEMCFGLAIRWALRPDADEIQ